MRKKSKNPKEINNENYLVEDFNRRIPFSTYTPCNYELPVRFLNYTTEIDLYLDKLFKGELDSGNGNVLDELILDVARETRRLLEQQHIMHQKTIRDLEASYVGSKKEYIEEIAMLEEDLKRVKETLKEYEERDKALEFRSADK